MAPLLHNRLDALLLALALGASLLAGPALAETPRERVTQDFIAAVADAADLNETVEIPVPDGARNRYFAHVLNLRPSAAPKVTGNRDVSLHNPTTGRRRHLGVAELEFASADVAAHVESASRRSQQRFFARTKILTRYVLVRQQSSVLLVYTETAADPQVNGFLDRVPVLRARWWADGK